MKFRCNYDATLSTRNANPMPIYAHRSLYQSMRMALETSGTPTPETTLALTTS